MTQNLVCLLSVRTNFGKFNIRFAGAKVWNSVDQDMKKKPPAYHNRKLMKKSIIDKYKNITFDNQ